MPYIIISYSNMINIIQYNLWFYNEIYAEKYCNRLANGIYNNEIKIAENKYYILQDKYTYDRIKNKMPDNDIIYFSYNIINYKPYNN